MPLIILTGTPASGKSKRANELKEFFESKQKIVHLISESEHIRKNYEKNEYFMDSKKEKQIRADVKSLSLGRMNKNDVVIMDAGNYIKGYRYEIYCATKAARTTQLTIYCAIDREKSWNFNENRADEEEKYTKEVFDALWMRYEEPNSSNRWDSPLFTVTPDESLNVDEIYSFLYEKKPPPANQSTQNAPLSSTNFLYELDKVTQAIVAEIVGARKIGVCGPVPITNCTEKVNISSDINASQLNRMRRQYINFSKGHLDTAGDLQKVPALFVQYLNSVLND
jgi:protein KTI12